MLPAPPSSCAGWWFAQLWRALLRAQPDRHAIWLIGYPEPGEIRFRPYGGPEAAIEEIAGTLHEGADRRCAVAWEWPGEDGMLHALRLFWQPGETFVRPIEWMRSRRPLPGPPARSDSIPWPLRVRLYASGWHGQTLERAELEAVDGSRDYPIRWDVPPGEPRLPLTELPCSLDHRGGEVIPALILAGLTLPWRIDLDREAWAVWRRISAGDLLRQLGGPSGMCPRHGRICPWPITGRIVQPG